MGNKNDIYENAFDWASEFPQLCDEKGDFEGFDVVIGNPPYIPLNKMPELKPLKNNYETSFCLFTTICYFYIEF